MRVDFVRAVELVLERDPSSMFVTGDLGYAALEGIAAKCGRRFLNAGVAEQNMVGVAAGLALAGMRPWIYSIAPFATYRCLEQIRNDVCLHRLAVRIVGNGGGYTYGIMGATHHALEDLAVLRPLPNLELFFPCSNDHVAAAVATMAALPGPAYLRLGISPFTTALTPIAEDPKTLTRQYWQSRGQAPRATIIGVGQAVHIALHALASGALPEHIDVFGVARFPWDFARDQALLASVAQSSQVITLEEHYASGGMGESLRAALPQVRSFQSLAAAYSPEQRYGSSKFHHEQCGLTPEALTRAVRAAVDA